MGVACRGFISLRFSQAFIETLAGLIGPEAMDLLRMTSMDEAVGSYGEGLVEWEEHLRGEITSRTDIGATEKQQLILARRGQGQFRKNVQQLERRCRVTRVDQPERSRKPLQTVARL